MTPTDRLRASAAFTDADWQTWNAHAITTEADDDVRPTRPFVRLGPVLVLLVAAVLAGWLLAWLVPEPWLGRL